MRRHSPFCEAPGTNDLPEEASRVRLRPHKRNGKMGGCLGTEPAMPAWAPGTRSAPATRGLQPVLWVPSSAQPGAGGLTRVEERGSRPQPLDIHHGVEGQQDEEGQGAQRGDVGDGPGGQRAS